LSERLEKWSIFSNKSVFGVPVVAILIGVVVLFVAKRGSK